MGNYFYKTFLYKPVERWLAHERPLSEIPLCDFDRIQKEIRPCDVLLIEGRTRTSDIIKICTNSAWSHAALFIGPLKNIKDEDIRARAAAHFTGPENIPLICESELGLGTVLRPIEVYRGEHVRICRPKNLHRKDAYEVIRYATSRLGVDYDLRQIFDLLRWLFPWWIMPRRWRSSLFSTAVGRTTRTICSSMIAEAFMYVKFPILPLVQKDDAEGVHFFHRNTKLFVPRDFDYSPYFDIIKYPFFEVGRGGAYRLLPWEGRLPAGTMDELHRGERRPQLAANFEKRILSPELDLQDLAEIEMDKKIDEIDLPNVSHG
jgi:hypothetical protein